MYLRKLTISGFKSFADAIEVEFDQGVTGIIGPNGCGKSNISDAIRWVLGEQNPRRLRGMQMSDMIFNGTATRPASGIAEVSLIFDNSDSFLPISYREVAITRRLYRNGDSDYQINQTKCRLKDITDLFLDSGIGTNAYSLMEQGRVDMIVNAKPRDRRAILEEAAGVSRFLHRKLEAMRKLERTEIDLNRIHDILGELQRRKRSLERQAKQAELARKYRKELMQVEYALHARAGKKLFSSLEDYQNRLKGLAARIQTKEGELAEVRKRKQALNQRLQEQDEINRKQRDAYASTTARLEQMERRLKDLKDHGAEYAQLQTRLEEECKTDALRIEQESARIEHAQKEAQRLVSEIEVAEKEISALETELRALNETFAKVEREGESRRKRFLDLEQQITELKNQQRVWERDREFYSNRLEQVRRERERSQGEIAAHERKTEELTESEKLLEEQRADLAERYQNRAAEVSQLSQEETEAKRQLQQCERAWQQTNSRWESLRDLQAKLAGFDEGVRHLLRGEGQSSDLVCTLAERIHVRAGYERAVDAALAQKLQAIVASSDSAVQSSIQRLRDRQKGRVAFLCASNGHPIADISTPNSLEGFPPLSDFVECESDWRPLIDRLLGQSLLVETLDQAMELRTLLPLGFRLVTHEGDVIDSDGAITGGHAQTSQILLRSAEITELEEKVRNLGEERSGLELRIKETQTRIATLTEERDSLKQQLMETQNQQRVVKDELQRLSQQLQRMRQNENALASEDEGIARNLETGAQQSQERATRLDSLAADKNRLDEEIQTWSARMDETRSQRRGLHERASDMRMGLLERKKDRERWAGEIETLERHLRELRRGIEEKQQLAQQQETRRKETETALTQTEEAILQLRGEQEGVWKEVSVNEDAAQEIRSEIHKIEAEESTHLADYETLRGERESASQDQLKLQVEQEYWRKRLDEDFINLEDKESCERDERSDEELKEKQEFYRRRLGQLGVVNELAIEEFDEVRVRCDFLEEQEKDLIKSKSDLTSAAKELHGTSVELFMETFELVKANFNRTFRRMFNGGRAELILQDGDPMEAGIDIEVQPPGKKLQSITLLSGGEKLLVAIALLFAVYEIKPCPFCFLDEIDAPLDDANIGRFTTMLRDFLDRSQFIMITHSKKTMEICDAIYGVTMPQEGVSTIYSMKFQKSNVRPMIAPESRKADADAGDSVAKVMVG